MEKNTQAILYAAINAMLVAFAAQLQAGEVPLPKEIVWTVPLVVAVITAISPYFKRD